MSFSPATALVDPLVDEVRPFDRALRTALDVIDSLPALPMRSAAVASCHDRVLAERIRMQADLPAQDVASVGGYAVQKAACRGEGPWRFRLTGRLAIARNASTEEKFPTREAVRITAGAPVPPSLDTVVPTDAVRREGDYVTLLNPPKHGDGIRLRAADAKCGDAIAEPDRLLDARDIMVLATAGYTAVKVRRTLRVAVLAMANGRQDKAGAAVRGLLAATMDRRWIGCQDVGAVSGSAMTQTLRTLRDEMDICVAVDRGGMAEAICSAGGRIVLDGIGMHPGYTTRLALFEDMVILLLPDNPVEALTAMAVLGWPLLKRRAGIQQSRRIPRAGIAAFSLETPDGCATFPLIRVAGSGEVPTLEAMADQMASDVEGSLSRLARADGIALVSPEKAVRFGQRVAWLPLTDRFV